MPPPHAVEDSIVARGPSTKPLWNPAEEAEDSPSAWMERPLQPCEPESPEASTSERGRALFHPACWASLRDALNPLAYNPPPAPLSQDCDASPGAFHVRGSEESFDQSIHLGMLSGATARPPSQGSLTLPNHRE